MRVRLSAAFLLLALPWPLVALGQDFAIPPTPNRYVTDNAGALSNQARTSLENELRTYERSTGHQVVVWIDQATGGVPLETWTGETADRWKIGRRGKDDGAVLFVFMRDHKMRIEVGYGLESALTDADAHRIIAAQIVPRMKAGDVDGAVSSGVAAMLTTITPAYAGVTPPPQRPATGDNSNLPFVVVFIGLSVLFFLFMVVMQVVRALRYGYLFLHEGSARARKDMKGWPGWAVGGIVGAGSSFGGGGGGFGGGFSAGGGGFGGGGASGGW